MVSRPAAGTMYLSRRSDLRLVVKPERKRHDPEGNVVETLDGQHIAFRDGKLHVPAAEHMRGEKGEQLATAAVKAFLEAHPLLGDREEGFWSHKEPAPTPTQDELDRVTELAMDLDAGGLRELIDQEEAGWGRETLLGTARSSLERVDRKLAEQAEAVAKAREGAGKGTKGA